jgi:hypothetical protein
MTKRNMEKVKKKKLKCWEYFKCSNNVVIKNVPLIRLKISGAGCIREPTAGMRFRGSFWRKWKYV